MIPRERLDRLFADAEQMRRRHQRRRAGRFHGFVAADYQGCYEALLPLRERAHSFLELGAGTGVITILADLCGFDAYGIEIEPWLVESARELAAAAGSGAVFAEGSFVPAEFAAEAERHLDPDFHVTYGNAAPAYPELGLDLADFDLVYAFPWPGEESLFFEIMRACGRPDGLFLTYGATEGFQLHQPRP